MDIYPSKISTAVSFWVFNGDENSFCIHYIIHIFRQVARIIKSNMKPMVLPGRQDTSGSYQQRFPVCHLWRAKYGLYR